MRLLSSSLSLLAMLLLSGPPSIAAAAEEGDAEAMAGSILQNSLPEEMNTILPIGRTFYGVAIPSYDDDVLQSVMRADTVTRVNKRRLNLSNLLITVHSGSEKTTIFMEEAVYDLVLGTLRSRTPARIEQPQFTMTGDTMTFDTRRQVSRLRGNVKVVVPDANALAPNLGFPIP